MQRWLSRDPIGEAGGLNLYRFCLNSPLDRTDPNGEFGLVEITTGVLICAIVAEWYVHHYEETHHSTLAPPPTPAPVHTPEDSTGWTLQPWETPSRRLAPESTSSAAI